MTTARVHYPLSLWVHQGTFLFMGPPGHLSLYGYTKALFSLWGTPRHLSLYGVHQWHLSLYGYTKAPFSVWVHQGTFLCMVHQGTFLCMGTPRHLSLYGYTKAPFSIWVHQGTFLYMGTPRHLSLYGYTKAPPNCNPLFWYGPLQILYLISSYCLVPRTTCTFPSYFIIKIVPVRMIYSEFDPVTSMLEYNVRACGYCKKRKKLKLPLGFFSQSLLNKLNGIGSIALWLNTVSVVPSCDLGGSV